MKRNRNKLAITLFPAALGMALLLPSVAFANPASKEVASALQRADSAAHAKNIKDVHMHLRHAINCLVGPNGYGFDSKASNPCKSLGNGAIPDTQSMANKRVLQAAVQEAQLGVKESNLKSAHTDASIAARMLKRNGKES